MSLRLSPFETMKNSTISSTRLHLKHIIYLIITLLSLLCIFRTLQLIKYLSTWNIPTPFFIVDNTTSSTILDNLLPLPLQNPNKTLADNNKTQLQHIVFGIACSKNLWQHRKKYIKLWWRPGETRGSVWLDKPVKGTDENDIFTLPPLKVSSDTSKFKYTNKEGDRSGIRISRIVSETVRLGLDNVRWIVMGDDDTVFVVDNLVRVLQKYDHNGFYYIGSSSESHLQNLHFSYNMAYGGGGFAISYPLAKALEKVQDGCLHRFPDLYGSDDRIQACMAEFGVPLTKEVGFHQFDVYGNAFGLLAAHPVAPLVSLHHLDKIDPIFPNVDQVQALERLKVPTKLDSAALMQQSICYNKHRKWTFSVSWGYAVQIFRGLISAYEVEKPSMTFVNWYPEAGSIGFPFNTRPISGNGCQMPLVYMLSNVLYNPLTNETASEYVRDGLDPKCKWKRADPVQIRRVRVYKKPDPHIWDKAPRRNCCRIFPSKKRDTILIDVGACTEGEISDG